MSFSIANIFKDGGYLELKLEGLSKFDIVLNGVFMFKKFVPIMLGWCLAACGPAMQESQDNTSGIEEGSPAIEEGSPAIEEGSPAIEEGLRADEQAYALADWKADEIYASANQGFRSGAITVPLDYNKPEGLKVQLSFAVYLAKGNFHQRNLVGTYGRSRWEQYSSLWLSST